MKNFADLRLIKDLYDKGDNITQYIRSSKNESFDQSEMIELIYDLQAGTYIKYFEEHRGLLESYAAEITSILDVHVRS